MMGSKRRNSKKSESSRGRVAGSSSVPIDDGDVTTESSSEEAEVQDDGAKLKQRQQRKRKASSRVINSDDEEKIPRPSSTDAVEDLDITLLNTEPVNDTEIGEFLSGFESMNGHSHNVSTSSRRSSRTVTRPGTYAEPAVGVPQGTSIIEKSSRRPVAKGKRKRIEDPVPVIPASENSHIDNNGHDDSTASSSDDEDTCAPGSEQPSKKARTNFRPRKVLSSISNNYRANKRLRQHVIDSQQEGSVHSSILGKKNRESASRSFSGIVTSIKMFNFMCHDGFYQEWHPNLNFVTGENGSGKSALLTALLIGLGAKATVTSRTKNMTSLIQKGKDSARTEITLLNEGALPVEKYGREIGIERTISKKGTSSYRIKTRGAFRKIRKHELDYIKLALNIQLENPVAILNQEVAKNFLRTKDPKDKYRLFYQGTLMDKLFDLLHSSRDDISVTEKNLESYKAKIEQLRKEVADMDHKLKEVENLTNIKRRAEQLKLEYLWAIVIEEEKKMEALRQKVEGHDDCIQKLKKGLEDSLAKRARLQEAIQPSEDETEARAKIKEHEQEIDKLRKKMTETEKSVQMSKARIKTNRDMLRRKERTLNDVKGTLEKLRFNAAADKDKLLQDYEESKQRLIEEKQEAVVVFEAAKRDCNQFEHQYQAAREETRLIGQELGQLQGTANNKQRQLDNLMAAGGNRYAMFGRNMENLMSRIAACKGRFRQVPRGPVASSLTVTDPRYVDLVEYILGINGFIFTFIVDNQDDLVLLQRLIKECFSESSKKPGIKVNRFAPRRYNIAPIQIEGAKTILDVMDIQDNDHVIANGLADYVEAERVLLFNSNADAARVMKDESICSRYKIKYGFTLEYYRFNPAPLYSATALDRGSRARFLQSSKTAQIESLKGDVQEMRGRIEQMKQDLEVKKRYEADLRKRFDALRSLQDEKMRIKSSAERALAMHESRNRCVEPDLASHEEEIKELETEIEKLNDENEEAQGKIDDVAGILAQLGSERKEQEAKSAELQKDISDKVEYREKLRNKLAELGPREDRFRKKIRELETEKDPLTQKLQSIEKECERKAQDAEAVGQRVNTTKSGDQVRKEVEKALIRITSMEKNIGDVEKLKKVYQKKRQDLKTKVEECRPIYRLFLMLKELVESQAIFLFKKRSSMSNGLTYVFRRLVEERGYNGKMMIDHDKQELHFFVCPDKSSERHAEEAQGENSRQAKKTLVEYSLGLSGGERSFSTICFILSLWQVMECPFYMLDEFDVFMDAFNRKTSQQALITHAKLHANQQFFLFSPLDLVDIPSKEEAVVIRLKPARPSNDNDVTLPSGNRPRTNDGNLPSARTNRVNIPVLASDNRPGTSANLRRALARNNQGGTQNTTATSGKKRLQPSVVPTVSQMSQENFPRILIRGQGGGGGLINTFV